MSLIRLQQIKGGLDLRNQVDQLLASYQAAKVLTTIAKDGDAGNYNVEELLTELKTIVDEQLGGSGSGSVDDKIEQAKTELQGLIDAINQKTIKDKVRITGKYTVDGGTVSIIETGLESILPKINKSENYPIYTLDNRPLVDASGVQITYNFTTQTLSGTPHKRNPEDKNTADGVSYIPVTEDTNFKLFGLGSFTFAELNDDFLLDNEEISLVYYAHAIDEIVVGLAEDQELIDSIKNLVGAETVQNQIKAITDVIDGKINTLRTEYDAYVLANDARVQAVEIDLAGHKSTTQAKLEELENSIGGINAVAPYEVVLTQSTANVWKGTAPENVTFDGVAGTTNLMVNGLTYRETAHYTVDKATLTVTWTKVTASGGFELDTTDEVVLVINGKKTAPTA